MDSLTNALGSWLLYSSLMLLMVLFLIQIARQILIRLSYSRTVILKLWLSIPISFLAYFVVAKWVIGQHYIEPISFSFPVPIQSLSETESFYFDWKLLLVLVWAVVTGYKILRLIHQYLKTRKTILTHAELIQVDGYNKVYSSDLDLSPMAIGLIRTKIVIPQTLLKDLTPAELDLVILHESIHCRRADPLWRFAMACLHSIYWFLPGFGFSRAALIEDQEFACDEQVIRKSQQLSVYARLLLSLNLNQPRRAFNETILCAASFNLKERIMKLNQVSNKKHQASITSLFFLGIFAISSVFALPQFTGENAQGIELIPTHKAAPKYPYKAFKENLTGQVTVAFTVTQEGKVTDVEVVKSTPAEVFDNEAVKAMEQWTFEPIKKETRARQVIAFELDSE